jgi:hypothetical protein
MASGRSIPARQWPAWLNATVVLIASWIAIAALSLRARADAEVVTAVFPPWWNARQAFVAVASANAAVVRTTAVPSLLVVRPADNDGLTRLHQAGAWLIIDPQAVAACFKSDGLGASK